MENKENKKSIHKVAGKQAKNHFSFISFTMEEKKEKKDYTYKWNLEKNENLFFFLPHVIRVGSDWSVKKLYFYCFRKLNHRWNLARHIWFTSTNETHVSSLIVSIL